MKSSKAFKTLALAAVLAGFSISLGGCTDYLAPPAYSSSENSARIWRYADYDRAQLIDDFDKDVTMSRPPSHMSYWNIVHHD